VFLIGVGEALRPLGELATLIVSLIALVIVLFFPDGLLGLLQGSARRG
jgi:branched-chain amino acid transport system permease protein